MGIEPPLKVLAFDVFGTVVDWYGSVAREVEAMKLGVPGGAFALAWRAGYPQAMDRVRRGELGWTKIDDLHRMILDGLLERFHVEGLDEAAIARLNHVWHRLDPWPDAVRAIARLRRRFIVCTLSNGNLGLQAELNRHAGIDWGLILSAETFRHYKPDPETYLGVCEIFDIRPSAVMLVAAHRSDLRAAIACGCRGAFVERPLEYGPDGLAALPPAIAVALRTDLADDALAYAATDLHDLADQLGCPA